MRKRTLLLLAVVLGVAVLAGASAVHAQIAPVPVTPPSCRDVERYDHSGDGRVDWQDFDLWVRTVHQGLESCRIDGDASGCPSWVDVNGDGIASVADLDGMFSFMMGCMGPPRHTAPQPGL